MNNYIGINFTDGIREYQVIEYMEQFKMYRLKNYTDNKENELMKKEQINKYLDNKSFYDTKLKKHKSYLIKFEEEKKRIEEKERKEKEQYNFCYGFCDRKTDLQKGKILKILNTKMLYRENIMTRKEIIEFLMKKYKQIAPEEHLNTNRISKKINLEYRKLKDKLEYRIYFDKEKSGFLEVTKTEYDYCNYLLENKLIS
ncbi:hypothetical protein RSJ2_4172 (plasmid) [Clostridium botulinum]|uniref:hypothetical protein n=1 Tax=Clostridium botulinum TaxID=1491 RepID=UPI0004655D5F|nr:hypothetical protein [Clostridium botulinum]APR02493.1 hypothetical protein RSJ2_4172 [Clostridium botulinum]MBN3352001.1 hypothetical protein [Clostridium botulinum]